MAPSPPIGRSFPLGATCAAGGVNFSLFSRHATHVDLLLFDREDDPQPARVVALDAAAHRTYHYWHGFVRGIGPGQIYAYRVDGDPDASRGHRFDRRQVLLDPYGRGVTVPRGYSRDAALRPEPADASLAMKSVVFDPAAYDWEGDTQPNHPWSRTIIYELHVRGFTQNPNSSVAPERRGTYAGLVEKIPYLRALGITTMELLPVFQFDAQDAPPGRVNFWGYAPVSFFAPHQAYSSRREWPGPADEFRDLVKALHRAGIEVILDVVFNHTAEGDAAGPTFGFRGIDNVTYYMLEDDRTHYKNYSGTGNTLHASHPVVRRMILDSLRYWVAEMHVDGFRFDLASILARDASGRVQANPPLLWDIESDPMLAGRKLIAEAWDAAGLYQVGSFVGDSWREWNGLFRDDLRSFLRGDEGFVRRFADRLIGSPDIYGHENREAEQSINFVTCHDGFTLNDLVSYHAKHNADNGEENRDGAGDNRSWNGGVEGPSDDPAVEALRSRQVRNFLTLTLLSIGVPMILMGDEVRRTQRGNNNAYCQDNEIGWFDWSLLDRHADLHRFTQRLIDRRLRRDPHGEHAHRSLNELIQEAVKTWHGVQPGQPDWRDVSHTLALTVAVRPEGRLVHVIVNAYHEALEFHLPESQSGHPLGAWRRWIDTSLPSPADIVPWEDAPALPERSYSARDHSVVVLITPLPPGEDVAPRAADQ